VGSIPGGDDGVVIGPDGARVQPAVSNIRKANTKNNLFIFNLLLRVYRLA